RLGPPFPPPELTSCHAWLLPPLQSHSSTFVPLAVSWPKTSRQRPEPTPVTVPLALTFHAWLLPPLQVQTVTTVPLATPPPDASRHLPLIVICLLLVVDHS